MRGLALVVAAVLAPAPAVAVELTPLNIRPVSVYLTLTNNTAAIAVDVDPNSATVSGGFIGLHTLEKP